MGIHRDGDQRHGAAGHLAHPVVLLQIQVRSFTRRRQSFLPVSGVVETGVDGCTVFPCSRFCLVKKCVSHCVTAKGLVQATVIPILCRKMMLHSFLSLLPWEFITQ